MAAVSLAPASRFAAPLVRSNARRVFAYGIGRKYPGWRAAESKLAYSNGRLANAEEDRQLLRQLNETLLANLKEYQVRLKAAEEKLQQTAAEKDAAIRELHELVRQAQEGRRCNVAPAASGQPAMPTKRKKPAYSDPDWPSRRQGVDWTAIRVAVFGATGCVLLCSLKAWKLAMVWAVVHIIIEAALYSVYMGV